MLSPEPEESLQGKTGGYQSLKAQYINKFPSLQEGTKQGLTMIEKEKSGEEEEEEEESRVRQEKSKSLYP